MNKTNRRPRPADIEIRNAKIMLKNFSGKQFPDGKRTFAVIIEDEAEAHRLMDEGWRLKTPRNDEECYFLPVKVRFDIVPPKIYINTPTGPVSVGENEVDKFDSIRIYDIDLYITPSVRDDGVTAYLHTMVCKLDERRPSFMDEYGI